MSERIYLALHSGALSVFFGSRYLIDHIPTRDMVLMVSDFNTTQALAQHIQYLDRTPEAYLKHFAWRHRTLEQTSPQFQRVNAAASVPWQCVLCERLRTLYMRE